VTLFCTEKQFAWAAWRRGADIVSDVERAKFEVWWAKILRSQPRMAS